jgi:hypothetical protein
MESRILLDRMYDVPVRRNVSSGEGVRIMAMSTLFPRVSKRKKGR